MTVVVDVSAAVQMLDRVAGRASNLTAVLERAAARGRSQISGIPVDTGKLAASPRVRTRGDNEVQIYSDVRYARFVFRGTRHMAARPPDLNAGQLARFVAEEVAREVFR